ncbi:MAG: hypothetical protein JO291_03060 [Acidimicrobiia bacterium]|nr:hypothetical protein [Acidimicrobiia bacterium]
MKLGAIRWAAMGVFFLVGIPGMIVSSVTDHTGAALTFGLVTVGAVLLLIGATAAVTGRIPPEAVGPPRARDVGAESEGAELEAAIEDLVASGADETKVRDLVRRAVRLGRTRV